MERQIGEEEMEMEFEPVFEVREIDLDYEFEAAQWFDFTRDESSDEASVEERWFDTAKSYSPSPFTVKLVLRENGYNDNVNTCPKLKDVDGPVDNDSQNDMVQQTSAFKANSTDSGIGPGFFTNSQSSSNINPNTHNEGLKFGSPTSSAKHTPPSKSTVKRFQSRSSTLLKPTASQLAKQNITRLQMAGIQNNDKSLYASSVLESQAAKRQKLEGGLLRKVADSKQQTSLVHKAPRKDVDRNSTNPRMRLTIPRGPDFETSQRAQRIRPKKTAELHRGTSPSHRFKARPLNRKILEAPSMPLPKKSLPRMPEFHEFHLKTSERAMQHSSMVSSSARQSHDNDNESVKPSAVSLADSGNKEARRPNAMDASRQDDCSVMYNFKAHPLDKKILSSKGAIGMFRNSKKETTVPMEFNFHTEKRNQRYLPTELFSKLSIASEFQSTNGVESKCPHSSSISTKGLKENKLDSVQAGHGLMQRDKETPSVFGWNQIQCANNGNNSEAPQPQWIPRRYVS